MTPLTEDDLDFIKNRAEYVDPHIVKEILEGCKDDLHTIAECLNSECDAELKQHYLALAKKLKKEKRIWQLIFEYQEQILEAMQEEDRFEDAFEKEYGCYYAF